jgi:pantetheine-phosphate adenylyltransferase
MNKKNIAVLLPGSYDPPTKGHLSLVERAVEKYERVHVVAFVNPKKVYTFTPEEREEMLRRMTAHLPSVTVGFSDGFVIDYAKKNNISLLIKGYRNETDLAYEKLQADWNLQNGGIETLLLPAAKGTETISSTAARTALDSENLSKLLSESVLDFIKKRKKT